MKAAANALLHPVKGREPETDLRHGRRRHRQETRSLPCDPIHGHLQRELPCGTAGQGTAYKRARGNTLEGRDRRGRGREGTPSGVVLFQEAGDHTEANDEPDLARRVDGSAFEDSQRSFLLHAVHEAS